MSSPEESTSINIIKNLKVLEELAGQDSIEDSQVANIYELLIETTEWTYETIMSEEIEIALQILDHLYFLDKVATASSQKFDFNRVFTNARLTFAINYNIACCYQILFEISSVSEFMENSLGILVEYLGLPSHKKSETIHLDPRILILDKNEDMIGNVLKLRLLFLLVKSFLQNAAVNSQLMKHETALRNANLGKFYFKLLIHNMEYMIGLYVKLTKQVELKASSRSRQEDDMAYFAPELDIPELRRFQRLVSNSVLHDFAKFSKEVLENDPTELINRQANERNELSNVIFWKHNSENNEKYFKKELAARSRDLGVSSKLTTAGLKDFNIGNVMHIKPISINKLNEEVEFTDYFGVKLAVEILLTYCCCLFSIATENRFICQKEFEAESKINEFKGGSIESKKSLKIYKLQKNRNFVASEKFHFTAIELLCAFVEDCPLLNHLMSSYQKNYFPSLEAIREEESQNTSFVSGHSSLLPGGYEKENEYDYKKIFDKSLRNNSVTEKSPDDSFRYPSKIMHNDDSFNETENIIRKLEGKMFTNEDFCSDQDNEVLYNSYQSDHKTFTTKDKEDFLKIMDSENNNKKSVIFVSPSFIASSSNQGKHSDVKFFNPEKSGSPQETKSALNSSDNLNKESTSSGQTPKQKVKDFISSLANNYFSNPTVHNSERVDKPVAHLEISSSNRNKLSNKNEQKSDPMLSPNPTPKSVVNKEKIYDKMENHRVGKRNKINNNVIETNNKKEESKFYIVENGSRKWVVGQQCTSQQDWGYSRDGFEEEGLHEIGQNQNQSNLSDSIQEKEVRISFKMDPESRQSPIETPIHELTKENQLKRGLPGVKPLHINPETVKIIEISNKKVRETFNSKKQITSLAAIRKESIGKKLKDALTNLKSGSNGEQAFKKKAEFNVITASSKNTSRNVSPATQILSKVKSRFSGQNNKAGNSIATTLNAIMNRSRKSSVGSKESSRSKFNSGALIKSIIKPMEKALNSSSCQSEKNSVESKKRTKLTFSGSKKPAGSNQIGGIPMIHFDEREVMKSSRTDQGKFPKSNSNSTSRLFNKIFSRDQESAGKSMEEGRFKSLNRESVQTRTRPNLSEFERNLNNSDKKEKAKGVGLDSLIQKMYQAGSSKALSEHYLTTERSVTSTEKQLNPKAHEKKEQSKTESLLESRKPSNHSARNNDASTLREKLKKTLLSGEKKGAKSRIHTSKTNPEGERTLNSSKYDQSESDLHENQSSKTSLLTERFLRMDFMKKNLLLENEKPSQKAAYKDEMRNTNLQKQIFQNNLLKSKSQIKSTRVSPLPKTEKYQESKLQYSINTNYLPQANKKQKSPLREKKELKLEFDFPSLKPAELAQQRYQKNQTNYTSSISFGLARKQSSGFSQRK